MAIGTLNIWNGSEWVNACSGRLSIWTGSAWQTLGEGESIYIGDDTWLNIVCAGIEYEWLTDDEPYCEKELAPERTVEYEWIIDDSPACEKAEIAARTVEYEWVLDDAPSCEKLPFPERVIEYEWIVDVEPSCEKLEIGFWQRTGLKRCFDYGNSHAAEEEFENTLTGNKEWRLTTQDAVLCPIFTFVWANQGVCEDDENVELPDFSGMIYFGHIAESTPTEALILALASRNYATIPGGRETFDMSSAIGGRYPVIAYPATWPDITDIRDDSGNDNIYPDMRKVANVSIGGVDYKVYRYDHVVGILENFNFYVKWV